MKIQLRTIADGFTNLIKDKLELLDEERKQRGEKRMAECKSCQMRIGNVCSTRRALPHVKTGTLTNGCGCNLAAKVLADNSHCPVGKW